MNDDGSPSPPAHHLEPPGTGPDPLVAVLRRSQELGFLGPGPVETQVAHAAGFARAFGPGGRTVHRFLDLGSGGGVPGLVLALLWPEASVVLLDAAERRCTFLLEAVEDLGLGLEERVTVVRARAEEAGRFPVLRGTFDLVVARSFGAPAVVAECTAPFLHVGGTLVVSEPPAAVGTDGGGAGVGGVGVGGGGGGGLDTEPAVDRWPAAGLAPLGLEPGEEWTTPYHYREFRQVEPCPDRYPRRTGIPAKRPLF